MIAKRGRAQGALFFTVIPGRAEGANPESKCVFSAYFWIPGPVLTRCPGMTGRGVTRVDGR